MNYPTPGTHKLPNPGATFQQEKINERTEFPQNMNLIVLPSSTMATVSLVAGLLALRSCR